MSSSAAADTVTCCAVDQLLGVNVNARLRHRHIAVAGHRQVDHHIGLAGATSSFTV